MKSVKSFADLTAEYFTDDFLSLNYLEFDSKVIEEDEEKYIVRNTIEFISRGVMKPVFSTNISFFTIVNKSDLLIKNIYVNENVESIRGEFLTSEYDSMIYEYGRQIMADGYIKEEIDKIYQ